ncbi:bifunctional ADP-dependent NAD(P)H-hydrate dehydratase/NAD(P)H-hydrate epimerase [Buchananella felis]|uniref:bifunctional ADP-dependent NAD(P)H-hydrate dehydratase/NAD(P)H-hydrate epimerase n=1 Tax=Buchananella felis TaxID=3231492 RepID=UPI00352718C9
MKAAHLAGDVRAAEAALVAAAPPDHWMRQAAAHVARAVRGEIRARGRGVYGARVLVLAGAGDNGGDGLYAAALLARGGVEVRAVARREAPEQGGDAPQATALDGLCGPKAPGPAGFSRPKAPGPAGFSRPQVSGPDGARKSAATGQDANGQAPAVLGTGWRAHPRALQEALRAGVRLEAEVSAELAEWAASADVLVDALTGTGVGRGPGSALRGPARSWVEKLLHLLPGACGESEWAANARPLPAGEAGPSAQAVEWSSGAPQKALRAGPAVVAVDLPSGICPDSGEVHGPALPATLTVTIGSAKAGLLLPPAAHLCGRVELVLPELFPASAAPADAGPAPAASGPAHAVPAVLRVEDSDVRAHWPVPPARAHKYTRGVLGLLAGSRDYPGAAVLAATAAVEAGVGMLRLLPGTTEQNHPAQPRPAQPRPAQADPEQPHSAQPQAAQAVLAACPEAVPGEGRVQARVLGPGLSAAELPAAGRLIEAARADCLPLVIDATGLGAVEGASSIPLPPLTVLTPHAGELAQLLARLPGAVPDRAEVEARPAHWARRAAQLTGAVVLLKGAVTVVAPPHGSLLTATGAPAWLATAGAGDVLSGLLGALLSARGEHLSQLCASDPAAAQSELACLSALAAHVHARAAAQTNPGGPLRALAVARQLPATLAELLAAHPAPPPGGVPSKAAGGTSAIPGRAGRAAAWRAAPQISSRRGRGRMTP